MSALISDCGLFRYWLHRAFIQDGPRVLVIMVNPSIADAENNDPTIRRILAYGRLLIWGEIWVGNLGAIRSTSIKGWDSAVDPIGPLNNGHLLTMMVDADQIIVAWGSNAKLPVRYRDEWQKVRTMADALGKTLWCWGVCKDGHPRHPLMIRGDIELEEWMGR